MPLAGNIVDQHHASRSEMPSLTVACVDRELARQHQSSKMLLRPRSSNQQPSNQCRKMPKLWSITLVSKTYPARCGIALRFSVMIRQNSGIRLPAGRMSIGASTASSTVGGWHRDLAHDHAAMPTACCSCITPTPAEVPARCSRSTTRQTRSGRRSRRECLARSHRILKHRVQGQITIRTCQVERITP